MNSLRVGIHLYTICCFYRLQIIYQLKQEELYVWHSYNVILIIPVPPDMLVYLKLSKTNYKWHKTKQFVSIKSMDSITSIKQTELSSSGF
jgi:hypothetical protein